MIDVKAYWVPLGPFDKPVKNAYFVIDITCLWWSRSICFHVHLSDAFARTKNGIVMEHGFGMPNMSNYQQPECEIREHY